MKIKKALKALLPLLAAVNFSYADNNNCNSNKIVNQYIGIGYQRGDIEDKTDNDKIYSINGITFRTSFFNYYGTFTNRFIADLNFNADFGKTTKNSDVKYADVGVEIKLGIVAIPQIEYNLYILGGYKYGYFSHLAGKYHMKGPGFGFGMSGQFLTMDTVNWFLEYKRYNMKKGNEHLIYRYPEAGLIFKF